MLLVQQYIIAYFMEAGIYKLSTLKIMWSVQFPPILRLRSLQKKLCQISLKRTNLAAIESLTTVVDGVLHERSIWWFLNNSDQFFWDKLFTGVHDTKR